MEESIKWGMLRRGGRTGGKERRSRRVSLTVGGDISSMGGVSGVGG